MATTGHLIGALAAIFVICYVCSLLPLLVLKFLGGSRSRDSKRGPADAVFDILTFFGGGVLLSTCFIHLLPETKENYAKLATNLSVTNSTGGQRLNHEAAHAHIPCVELAICCGFFVIYLLETLVHMFLGHGHAGSEGHSHGSQQSTDSINYQSHINQAFEEYQRAREESRARNDSYAARQRIPPITVTSSGDNRTILFTSYKSPEPVALPSLPRYQGTYTSNHSGDHFMPTEAHRRPLAARVISGLISIAAFAVHEIFDGVTIGVRQSPTRIWTIFGAIATHKAVMAFAVGTSVHEQAVTMTLTSVLLLFYAILTPVGILVIMFAQQALESESLAVIILQSFSIGTIIYVVFYELLRVKDATGKLLTMSLYFSMIAGFAAMTCLTLFVVDE